MKVTSHLLTKERDSIILGRGNDAGQHINKGVINKLQSVAWEVNEEILPYISDELSPSEEPLSAFEEAERLKSFKLRDKETDVIIDYLLENGNRFYFGWKYDTRGRSYSQGYHINIQANEYRKAMISYADKELLTPEGEMYLRIDIANHLGYDKETWGTRLLKASKVIKAIFASGELDIDTMLAYKATASSPLLFVKAIFAWKNGVLLKQPIGHNCALDSTASGLQVMSALSGCCTTARNTNIHAKVIREYTVEVAEKLAELEAELASL